IEQTPVGTVGSAAVGSKQGTHLSSAPHTSVGKRSPRSATAGMHWEMHRPSAPATDTHERGTKLPALSMKASGAHEPGTPPSETQLARRAWPVEGMSDCGTQCAPPQAGLHAGKIAGLSKGGPV